MGMEDATEFLVLFIMTSQSIVFPRSILISQFQESAYVHQAGHHSRALPLNSQKILAMGIQTANAIYKFLTYTK